MKTISCHVIQDLLPLYCDQVCSRESQALVEEHLKTCPQCSALLGKMQIQCRIYGQEEEKHEEIVRDMAAAWKKSQRKSCQKGLLIALLVCLLLAAGHHFLENWVLVPIPVQRILSLRAEEGESQVEVSYQAQIQSKVSDSTSTVTQEGKYYFTERESILRNKKGGRISHISFALPKEITADSGEKVPLTGIYYGTPGDCVAVWEAQ